MSNIEKRGNRRPQNDGKLMMEGAKIIFRNFAGEPSMYNEKGNRNFCLVLDPETADKMAKDGWNVKFPPPREDGETRDPYMQVSLKFWSKDGRRLKPPTMVIISSKGRTRLTEEEAEVLDWVDIKNVDLIVRPFFWSMPGGKSGCKAMLQSIYITIEEDYLEQKYADLPEYNSIAGAAPLELEDPNIIEAEIIEEY